MTRLLETDRARLPPGKRGAFEGVARRHGRRRYPARMSPRSSLRTPTNRLRHHAHRWLRKVGRSDANSETPQLAVRYGARKSRYIGSAKATMHASWAAALVNLNPIARHLATGTT